MIERIDAPCITGKDLSYVGASYTLSKDSAYPLKTYEAFEADPLDSVLSACSRLSKEESLCVQWYMAPL
jgi:hypothetical protein